jgi:hypothetical protein
MNVRQANLKDSVLNDNLLGPSLSLVRQEAWVKKLITKALLDSCNSALATVGF